MFETILFKKLGLIGAAYPAYSEPITMGLSLESREKSRLPKIILESLFLHRLASLLFPNQIPLTGSTAALVFLC